MTQVVFRFLRPNGAPYVGAQYKITLPRSGLSDFDDSVVVPWEEIGTTDDQGMFVMELLASTTPYSLRAHNEDAEDCCGKLMYRFYVPQSDVPVQAQDLFIAPPPGSVPWDEEAMAKITQAVIDAKEAQASADASAVEASAAQAAAELARDQAEAVVSNITTDITAIQDQLAQQGNRVGALEVDNTANKQAITTLQGQMASEIQTTVAHAADISALKQDVLDLENTREFTLTPGSGLTIDRTDPLHPVINAIPDAPVTWGDIVGNLQDQTDLQAALMSKVTKIAGKDLSTNDFTDADKQKLDSLSGDHFRGLFLTLAELEAAVPVANSGDYADVDPGTGVDTMRYIWDTNDTKWVIGTVPGGTMTPGQIKIAYESNPDTNAYTNLEKAKLAGVAQGAEKNYQEVIQSEAAEGTETGLRSWSPLRVRQAIIGWWNQSASKTKLDGIQDNATVNATDAALRDRSTHTGTQTSSTISDFAASVRATVLSGFVDTVSGLVSATDTVMGAIGKLQNRITGHIGSGGTAHADASTTVSGFMSGADKTKLNSVATGAQVNYPAATQAQAENSSETALLSWAPVRVWQSVIAWWLSYSGEVGRRVAVAATEGAARTSIGCGTAATGTLTTSAVDQTTGRVLRVGDHGLGTNSAVTVTGDLNEIRHGSISGPVNQTNQPLAEGILFAGGRSGGARAAQIFVDHGSTSRMFFRGYNSGRTADQQWSGWSEVMKLGDGGFMGDVPVFTGSTNIDDRTIRGYRFYGTSVPGTPPTGVTSGIFNTFGLTGDFVCQEFWEISTGTSLGRKWRRNCFGGQAWSPWKLILNTDSVGSAAFASISAIPAVNILPDSGRFAGKINPLQFVVSGNNFAAPAFFAAFNGATHTSGGQFIYDNSTNGGAAGALAEPVSSLLSAMGRTGAYARYGVEFFVDTLVFGSGTVSQLIGTDSVTRYLATTNGTRALFQADNSATIAMWMRARAASFHIATPYFKNGVRVSAGTPITVADGWVHIRVVTQNLMGFDNAWPYICGVSGGSVNIALPALFNGVADIGLHANPISTINELSN